MTKIFDESFFTRIHRQWKMNVRSILFYARRRRWRALLRSFYLRTLWYEGELCQECGRRYDAFTWWSPAPLWLELIGSYSGLLCPRCFTNKAKSAGYRLMWSPMVISNGGIVTTNHWLDPVRDRLLMGEPDPQYFNDGLVNVPQGHWGEIGKFLGWNLPSEYPVENCAPSKEIIQ